MKILFVPKMTEKELKFKKKLIKSYEKMLDPNSAVKLTSFAENDIKRRLYKLTKDKVWLD